MRVVGSCLLVLLASLGLPALAAGELDASARHELQLMENKFFEHTFDAETDESRVERLEKLVFGEAKTGDDAQRLAGLASVTNIAASEAKPAPAQAPAKAPARPATAAQPPATQSQYDEDAPDQSDYPRITALENEILGKAYAGQPVPERLSRLETKAFGKVSASTDLSDRTDALQAYAEKKLHIKVPDATQDDNQIAQAPSGAPQAQASKGSKLLSFVGNSLLGGFGGPAGPSTYGATGYSPGLVGGFVPGFGGVRVRQREEAAYEQPQDDQDNDDGIIRHADDPAVYAASPPPPSAPMLTSIGWAEVQVFGMPNSNLHLEQRLVKLNEQLNVAPGQTGLQLMDDVRELVAAAQKYGQLKAVGSNARGVTQ